MPAQARSSGENGAGGLRQVGGSDVLETPPLGWRRESEARKLARGARWGGTVQEQDRGVRWGAVGWGGAGRTGQTRSQDGGKDMGLEVVQQWGSREDAAPPRVLERNKTGLAEFGDEGHPDSREDRGRRAGNVGGDNGRLFSGLQEARSGRAQARRGSGA